MGIDFFFMPPLVYFQQDFDAKVQELYARFVDPSSPKYYFNTRFHFQKCVPVEGLYTWTKQIFSAITEDESLNIPDQQKLLSAYRCEHALNEAFECFSKATANLATQCKSEYVDGFGEKCDDAIKAAITIYKETANKYDKEEANEKYAPLIEKIEQQIQILFSCQYKHLNEKLMDLYRHEMAQSLPTNACVDNLSEISTTT